MSSKSVPSAGSSHDGDLTMTTSSSSTTSAMPPLYNSVALSGDALSFLSDLNNWLPLGCLCFEDFTNICDDDEDWVDVTEMPFFLGTTSLSSNLSRLLRSYWIRIRLGRNFNNSQFLVLRVYILPSDVGRRFVIRDSDQDRKLQAALELVLPELDIDPSTWQGRNFPSGGRGDGATSKKFDMWASPEAGSLFYHFNTLPSPAPSVSQIPKEERYSREALEDLLQPDSVPGLKTALYPYQRRTAGLMLQREAAPKLVLDPRLEQRVAPDGSVFYYRPRKEMAFFREHQLIRACSGGIVAESMGLGKTVILLGLIAATKDHLPKMPDQYSQNPPVRSRVGTLMQMAISATTRRSIPWKVEFERISNATGYDMGRCAALLEASPGQYETMTEPTRWNRTTNVSLKKLTMAATTLIVVPQNLVKQWRSEIGRHLQEGALKLLVVESSKQDLPPPNELRSYHIILLSRGRFDLEARDGFDRLSRPLTNLSCRCTYIGATRQRDCHCERSLFNSPLKYLHFKRLIIDEGQYFSTSGSNALDAHTVIEMISTDHRWIVSGTPVKDLLGVEVSIENLAPDTKKLREAMVMQRHDFTPEDRKGAIKSLGMLASQVLQIQPWCSSNYKPGTVWDDHIFRHESARSRTYSGFSVSFRRTLEAMIVKTQPADVEKDLALPPLTHQPVYLEPCFYDRLTANMFIIVWTVNAITSERTDPDYLLHKKNQPAWHELISNLRQSTFFWTGFSEEDVLAAVKNGKTYLQKETTNCSDYDRWLLGATIDFADTILASTGWKMMAKSHELGFFVKDWPQDSAEHWAFDDSHPLLTGVSQLLQAQKHVNSRTSLEDPGEGLSGAGIRALTKARRGSDEHALSIEKVVAGSPKKRIAQSTKPKTAKRARNSEAKVDEHTSGTGEQLANVTDLPPGSPFLHSQIVGCASAKMAYLMEEVLKYYREEKIIIFYEPTPGGKNVAFYIAQMLDLMHVKHEIYDGSLPAKLKSEYVVQFDQQPEDRVLLMDVKQAAVGLNLTSASRIYFVNPVCRPDVEAQAIKRAHRIGQTKNVTVETLILKGTIEENMYDRAKRMTRAEHASASKLEDDGGIREIIQNARLLPVNTHDIQMALLNEAQQLWGREDWRESMEPANIVQPYNGQERSTKNNECKRRRIVDSANADPGGMHFEEDEPEPDSQLPRKKARLTIASPAATVATEDNDDENDRSRIGGPRRPDSAHDPPRFAPDQVIVQISGLRRPDGFDVTLPRMNVPTGLTGDCAKCI